MNARESQATRSSPRSLWMLLALLAAALAAYQPAWHGGVLWDDDRHLTATALRSAEGLWRIWFDMGATQQYYPLTHSAFWLQYHLWGDATLGYHLVNITLHALSAFLVGTLLRRLAVPGAWLAAIIFALHPVHVESVAWMTELKNTLSGALYLGAALAYVRFDVTRSRRSYALALALFVLALLAKTVTATLPAVLLVIAWWQRGRVRWREDVAPLVPLFALGVGGGLLTAWAERALGGAAGSEFELTAIERLLVAGRAIWFYLATLAWPTRLMFIYPRWSIDPAVWWQYLYPVGVLLLVAALWMWRTRDRGPLAAFLIFAGTLVPALGFVNVYTFRYAFVADHYLYLASIPLIALASAAAARVAARRQVVRGRGGPAAAAAIGVVLAVLTWQQSRQYASAETLYRATLKRNPSCWLAEVNLGIVCMADRIDEAQAHFEAALRLKPDLPEARYNLGLVAQGRGQLDRAVAHYREAIRLSPRLSKPYNNLGDALFRLGRFQEARAACETAVGLDPGLAEAHYNLGRVLLATGQFAAAASQFSEAVRLGLDAAELRCAYGNALQGAGRLAESLPQYAEALRLRPDYAEAHNNLGGALLRLGRRDEGLAHLREALRINPAYPDAYYYLGNALQEAGQVQEAAAAYQAALRLAPGDAAVHNNLGVAFERLGRTREAAAEYEQAIALQPLLTEAREGLLRLAARGRR